MNNATPVLPFESLPFLTLSLVVAAFLVLVLIGCQPREVSSEDAAATTLAAENCADAEAGQPAAIAGCGPENAPSQQGTTRLVFDYDCRLKDGALAATTREDTVKDPSIRKASIFLPLRSYQPVIAGDSDNTEKPPLYLQTFEEKIAHYINEMITTLPTGRPTALELQADVPPDIPTEERYLQMARQFKQPRKILLKQDYFKDRYHTDPARGMELDQETDFPGRVLEVTDEAITILYTVKAGATIATQFGPGQVREEGEEFIVSLNVAKGELVRTGPLLGQVIKTDEQTFTIDFGLPFGGETLYCEVTPRAVSGEELEILARNRKPSHETSAESASSAIIWQKDLDSAMAEAGKEKKPLVLVLYADWCQWCDKLFGQVLPDARIRNIQERYVWLKINSDQEKEIYDRFEQKGYPNIILFDESGRQQKKIEGFLDSVALENELLKLVRDKNRS
ncbi:MAG: thioredoxin family protein [Proteobacteria bacterium]|nr:thioredoxin family protein [Pseudomonadota bacterium]MBU1736853.1 thioredoxin family protein [Pseudomonadota bacterium]